VGKTIATTNVDYQSGMAVFTIAKGGLMFACRYFRREVCLQRTAGEVAYRSKKAPGFALSLSGGTLRRVILFAPSAPAVQIFILTMRAFDRSQLIIEFRQRFAARWQSPQSRSLARTIDSYTATRRRPRPAPSVAAP